MLSDRQDEIISTVYEGRSDGRVGPGVIRVVQIAHDGKRTATLLREPRRHSPDGFQWGYGGSGPSDTALAILANALGVAPQPAMYHRFKFEVIADLPDNFTLDREDVIEWATEYNRRVNGG